ncbi:DUF4040 domain-containing protein [Haloglomus litoreum]|uniref:DUF4040 domain-containing protein n=1 Tax=Haloglomus litoreum TaxID=3034026 RepID=UPI0023E79D6F|nr:DUF4040 domain-containing protein [Haloglomus sp. DT116]
MTVGLVEAALLGFVLVVAVATALARDTLVAVVVFAPYSLGMAGLWLVYHAPDVALTEAAVGAAVTTSLFVVTLQRTTRPDGVGDTFAFDPDPRSLVVVGAFVGALLATVPALPPVGTAPGLRDGGAGAYYLANAADFAVKNVVTSVLVAFRGFDTFGEVAVVFAAGLAVLVVLGRETP